MGVVDTIKYNQFPAQSSDVGKQTSVSFHYEWERALEATIVRDDTEDPYITIFRLEDGRYVLATECQYRFLGGK